jgi:hypothetical protein
MKKELQEIINKYKEFKEYLLGFDDATFKNASREELTEFVRELRNHNSFRYLTSDVDKIIGEKKVKEYPELLGVHNYPEIKELTCISEEDKVTLDSYLVSLGFRSYLHKYSHAWGEVSGKWSDEVETEVFKFLVDREIIELLYRVELCHMSFTISKEQLANYFKYFELEEKKGKTEDEWDEYYELQGDLELPSCCFECDEEAEMTKDFLVQAQNSPGCYVYKVLKERNTALDNV